MVVASRVEFDQRSIDCYQTMGQPIAGTQLQDGGQELSDGMLRAQVDGGVGIRRDNS